MEEGSD
jgi:vacuolar-type H+-ATPase subunit H